MITKAHRSSSNHRAAHAVDDLAEIRSELTSLRESIGTHAHSIASSGVNAVQHAVADGRAAAGDLVQAGAKQARKAADGARKQIAKRPLTSVTVAAATGMAVCGALLLFRKRS